MRKREKLFFIACFIFLLIGTFKYTSEWIYEKRNDLINRPTLYGNDKESIVKLIKSYEYYENSSIEILEIKDASPLRFVGFLADGYPNGMMLQKDPEGNYRNRTVTVNTSSPFELLVYHHSPWFMIITNQDNKIAKTQLSVDGKPFVFETVPNTTGVTWIKLPELKSDNYSFLDYKYYDSEGNEITELDPRMPGV